MICVVQSTTTTRGNTSDGSPDGSRPTARWVRGLRPNHARRPPGARPAGAVTPAPTAGRLGTDGEQVAGGRARRGRAAGAAIDLGGLAVDQAGPAPHPALGQDE